MQLNLFSILEIHANYTKLLIVKLDKNKIYTVAADRILTRGYEMGQIVDEEAFLSFIDQLISHIKNKYKIESKQIILVLPTMDHIVHTVGSKLTIQSAMNIITMADIQRIRQDCRHVKLPDPYIVVEEIPMEYQLDSGKVMSTEPIHLQSQTLALKSAVHVLPRKYVEPIAIALDKKQIEILEVYLSSFACYSASKSLVHKLRRTIFVHYDDESITYSLFENHFLIKSIYDPKGENAMIHHLMQKYEVSYEDALNYFESLFLLDDADARDICIDAKNQFSEKSVSQEVLPIFNQMIEKVAVTLNQFKNEDKPTDIIFTGKWLDYRGFIHYFNQKYALQVNGAYLNEFGIRSQEFITTYGAFIRFLEQNKNTLFGLEEHETMTNPTPNEKTKTSHWNNKTLDIFDDED